MKRFAVSLAVLGVLIGAGGASAHAPLSASFGASNAHAASDLQSPTVKQAKHAIEAINDALPSEPYPTPKFLWCKRGLTSTRCKDAFPVQVAMNDGRYVNRRLVAVDLVVQHGRKLTVIFGTGTITDVPFST